MRLLAIIQKELRLLSRDIHGLLLLFVMPVVFIVIMSLAMKDDFDRRSGVQVTVLYQDVDQSAASAAMLEQLRQNPLFELQLAVSADAGRSAVRADQYRFMVLVREGAFGSEPGTAAEVIIAPSASKEMQQLLLAAVREATLKQRLSQLLSELPEQFGGESLLDEVGVNDPHLLQVEHAYTPAQSSQAPTSVQQNVPAWLVFSMFFVVVPLANTLINERQLGTLKRLRTVVVRPWQLMAGKMIPYFVINQLQVVAMLIVGVYLVPVLGGDRLALGSSLPGLVMICSALSIAALGYAMLIAVVARTTEQATTLGGAGNIILAAIGGIMVPSFVMPAFMQEMTRISPMSWGLEGFLDIFLRGGGVAQVWPEALALVVLGLVCLGVALLLHRRND